MLQNDDRTSFISDQTNNNNKVTTILTYSQVRIIFYINRAKYYLVESKNIKVFNQQDQQIGRGLRLTQQVQKQEGVFTIIPLENKKQKNVLQEKELVNLQNKDFESIIWIPNPKIQIGNAPRQNVQRLLCLSHLRTDKKKFSFKSQENRNQQILLMPRYQQIFYEQQEMFIQSQHPRTFYHTSTGFVFDLEQQSGKMQLIPFNRKSKRYKFIMVNYMKPANDTNQYQIIVKSANIIIYVVDLNQPNNLLGVLSAKFPTPVDQDNCRKLHLMNLEPNHQISDLRNKSSAQFWIDHTGEYFRNKNAFRLFQNIDDKTLYLTAQKSQEQDIMDICLKEETQQDDMNQWFMLE